jgi:hypothetical protein
LKKVENRKENQKYNLGNPIYIQVLVDTLLIQVRLPDHSQLIEASSMYIVWIMQYGSHMDYFSY